MTATGMPKISVTQRVQRHGPDPAHYFFASGHRPVIGPNASSPLIFFTTL